MSIILDEAETTGCFVKAIKAHDQSFNLSTSAKIMRIGIIVEDQRVLTWRIARVSVPPLCKTTYAS